MAVQNDVALWRAHIFSRILLFVLALGVLTAVPSIMLYVSEGLWTVVVIDIVALSWIAVIWRSTSISYTVRVLNFLAMAYLSGIGLLLKVGPVSQIYLMAVPVLAALLLGVRAGVWALAVATVTLLVIGFLASTAPGMEHLNGPSFLKWAVITLNYLFITAVLTMSCGVLVQKLVTSIDELRASAVSLERRQNDIHRLAHFDVLTGLPNRRLLLERLDNLLASSERSGAVSAVMVIDIDHFKYINDARGHAIGDALLKKAAERLLHLMRKVDTVARIGGDEFVVLLADLAGDSAGAARAAQAVGERSRQAIARDVEIGGQSYSLSASIGVTLLPKPGQTALDLLREADTAMYRAKADGRNGIAFFEATMQESVEQRLTIERDLAGAIDSGRLSMHLQPQLDRHARVVGAELLMRWQLADGSWVPPSLFIPVAEESGQILPLGQWALRQACEALLRLEQAGYRLPLSVNVSPSQFRQADFVEQVRQVLASTAAPAALLIFEVTEGLLIDKLDDTVQRMHELAALGIRFSIDDFGTGYSSLAYLKKMPLYELKIDRSFIQDTPDDASDTAIVQSILAMARHLKLRVVAEGVETRAQADFLIAHDCDCMQGYLYARPAPLEALLAMLGNEEGVSLQG